MKLSLATAAVILMAHTVVAAEPDPCTRFTWDVSSELAVMKQTPQPLTAALKPGDLPQLELGKLYDVQLATQSSVAFVVKPAKPTLDDGAQAGLARFHIAKAGRYRVSITSGHWIDVLDGLQMIKSRDFQGQRGCERPRKIVEYELPAAGEMTLQLSGSSAAKVILAITAAPGTAGS